MDSKQEIRVVVVGDLHVKPDNIPDVRKYLEHLVNLLKQKEPTHIVLLGDTLHTHEIIHTVPLNEACSFIETCSTFAHTYVLVGNHDMINCQQYLTRNHWLNSLKKWEGITVVDKPILVECHGIRMVMTPYTPNGTLVTALTETLGEAWRTADCIFAHQEFKGCKMGAIISEHGDEWDPSWPLVVSGHIHVKQSPQENVYYTGSAMQTAFGEGEVNIVAVIEFTRELTDEGMVQSYSIEEVDFGLARKQIIYQDVTDGSEALLAKIRASAAPEKIKVALQGASKAEFDAFKKTNEFKELAASGARITFKPKKGPVGSRPSDDSAASSAASSAEMVTAGTDPDNEGVKFGQILATLIRREGNATLNELYRRLIDRSTA